MPTPLKYRPAQDLPAFAKEAHTVSPTDLAKIVLSKRNTEVTPESVTMWFKRNPAVYEELRASIIAEQKPLAVIDPAIFENGVFEELASVKNMILEMRDRHTTEKYISSRLCGLRQICRGRFKGLDLVASGDMVFIHPDRMTLDDFKNFERTLRAKGIKDTSSMNLAARAFLESKQIVVGKKISGAKSLGAGKMADLNVEPAIIRQILDYVKCISYSKYVVDLAMYKTGTRVSAMLASKVENLVVEPLPYKIRIGDFLVLEQNQLRLLTIYDKGRASKYPEGHPWKKIVDDELYQAMLPLIGNRTSGLIFGEMYDQGLSDLNREALKRFCPWIFERYPELMPNHFWRHIMGQHCLRATGWNYGLTAGLGGWEVASLQESYGKMDALDVIRRGEFKGSVPTVTVLENVSLEGVTRP